MSKQTDPNKTWAIVKALDELIKEAGVSRMYIARESGLSVATLNKTLNGQTEPSLSTLAKIADAIGYEVEVRFEPK